jgi:integrase
VANLRPYRTKAGNRRVLAVVRIKGFRPVRKAFGTLRDAQEWAATTEAELRGQRDRGGARADLGTLTVRALVESFLEDPQTRQRRYHAELATLLAPWCNEYGALRARAFGRLQVVALRDKLTRGMSAGRTNRYLSAMRRCWNWGRECGYVVAPWPQKIMLTEPTPEAVLERYGVATATVDDMRAVIDACAPVSAELANLVGFMLGTGARVSDALAVRWRDVDLTTNTVAIRGQKTKRPLRVAMLVPAVEAVRRQRAGKVHAVDGRVFLMPNRFEAGRTFARARVGFPAALRAMRLHDCRHLCASFLAAHGASHVELAAQLGHTTLAMVKRYAHLQGGHRGEAHAKLDAAFSGKATR